MSFQIAITRLTKLAKLVVIEGELRPVVTLGAATLALADLFPAPEETGDAADAESDGDKT